MITIQETLSAARDFPVTGRYFKLLSTSAPVDVFFTKEGGLSDYALQITRGFYCRLPFDRVRVVPTGTQSVKFAISDNEAGFEAFDIAISATANGAAQGNDLIVDSGHAFYAVPVLNGPVAAQFSGYAIECAVGKRVYVDGVDYQSAVPGFVSIGAAGGLTQIQVGASLLNGTLLGSVSHRESGTAVATVGQPIELFDGAATWQRLRFPLPLTIDPGNAVYVWCATINTAAQFSIYFREY